MNINFNFPISALCALFLSFRCTGQQAQQKGHSLFHPVPQNLMREMETDRPDVTEAPFTVDAGHFQVETDLIILTKEATESEQINTLLINQFNFKVGITGSTDLQIGFQSYGRQKEKELTSGTWSVQDGCGDLMFRIKQNLIGNDHGNFVLSVLPYVKFPTSKYDENSRFEGGLIVPMLYKLPGEWKLGFQVEADRLKDKYQQAMHTEFLQSLTVSHPLLKGVEGITETYYTYDFKAHQFSNFINAAIQMEVARDFKLDAGLNYGIQHTAEKHYFIGASYRL